MINVLIADDSPVIQASLENILSSDPLIRVIAKARNGQEAVRLASSTRPDVITMDINMPEMDGLEAVRQIMHTNPVPVIIISGIMDANDPLDTFKALEAGAVTIMNKPRALGSRESMVYAKELIQQVRLLSEIRVIKRFSARKPAAAAAEQKEIRRNAIPGIIAIAASTGGPMVIQKILSSLPQGFSIPIILIQHIVAGFTVDFARWLGETSRLKVVIPENTEEIAPGICYVAPDGWHVKVRKSRIIFVQDKKRNICPSASVLFESVAEEYGPGAVGIILTGMGNDGAEELKKMKLSGAITIAQDKASSVVFGMPGEAVKIGAASLVLSPEEIIYFLKNLTSGN
ncbi:MAG: chemotaxis-specific protein-glutamate methyltransferase CheB [Ignavibacteria bacterium]|jgi:two-component system chemotaxis response regulator CheB|nr:chemotaxis-specific protein-glutamate methyltransferase CheB [Ignavibacteria bacterium]MCU7501762.1 chemotaxis-specific protein-glutamate methyltransferase CheB [Ignavibacteria bacterium]MCU7516831.1 chemotaxis-specific protein-glutamate methyltransferase CheB [Ignavibacteria bacterium]